MNEEIDDLTPETIEILGSLYILLIFLGDCTYNYHKKYFNNKNRIIMIASSKEVFLNNSYIQNN